jgi:xanthine dehydrogenase/oxidase
LIERVSRELNIPMQQVQERNFIKNGLTTILGQPIENCTLDIVWSTLLTRSRFAQRAQSAEAYNASSLWRKRGISVCPVK